MGELFTRYLQFRPLRLRDIEKAANEMGQSLTYAIGARKHYLYREIRFWVGVESDLEEWNVLCALIIPKLADDLAKMRNDIYWKDRPVRNGDTVTDEMKARAKMYPVKKLIEFNSQGKALCLWHDDKTPSLSVSHKTGKMRCYVCNQGYDAIDVVMVRDKRNYFDAVRYLCSIEP